MFGKIFQRVSESPTNPHVSPPAKVFDVADLYRGPVATAQLDGSPALALDEKLRQAYFWIVNQAIISAFYDIEYDDGPQQSFASISSKLLQFCPAAAVDVCHTPQVFARRWARPRQNLERHLNGSARRIFTSRRTAGNPKRPAANDRRRFARQPDPRRPGAG
jgi:hypothetical protein